MYFSLVRSASLVAALAMGFAGASAARADTIFNFTDATLVDGSPVTGTITINTMTGKITDANFTTEGKTFTVLQSQSDQSDNGGVFTSPASAYFVVAGAMPTDNFDVVFPLAIMNLKGYSGSQLCSVFKNCDVMVFMPVMLTLTNQTSYDATIPLKSGSLVPVPVPAPEPSSLVLLVTGMLGAAGLARRRLSA